MEKGPVKISRATRRRLTDKQRVDKAAAFLRRLFGGFTPVICITLGSGLGYLVELLEGGGKIEYKKIPGCPVPGATGHAGVLWWGRLCGVPVVLLQGRVHLYEGWGVNDVVFLTRVVITLGIKKLILTHATGAVTKNLEPTDIVAVWSQIAADCPDPTSGPYAVAFGLEFTPPSTAFAPEFIRVAKQCALEVKVSLHRGVSHFRWGRCYEDYAEGEAMARAGADVATMSTVPEVMAAAQMGARVLDLALVTDMVANVRSESTAVSSEEVLTVAEHMRGPFGNLVKAVVPALAAVA